MELVNLLGFMRLAVSPALQQYRQQCNVHSSARSAQECLLLAAAHSVLDRVWSCAPLLDAHSLSVVWSWNLHPSQSTAVVASTTTYLALPYRLDAEVASHISGNYCQGQLPLFRVPPYRGTAVPCMILCGLASQAIRMYRLVYEESCRKEDCVCVALLAL